MKRARQSVGGGACSYPHVMPRKPQQIKQTARKSTSGIFISLRNKYRQNKEQNPHCLPVHESHLDLLRQGQFSDVTFIVGKGKERIPSHQIFLKARSSVFAEMFTEAWNQDTNKEVPLEDLYPETFKQFLEFIYAEIFRPFDLCETLELLRLAQKFNVKRLISECEEVLKIEVSLDDAHYVFKAARTYQMEKLVDRVGELWSESLSELERAG